MVGDVLHENVAMLKLARALGFAVEAGEDTRFAHLRLHLQRPAAPG
jgi:hypothetical protein